MRGRRIGVGLLSLGMLATSSVGIAAQSRSAAFPDTPPSADALFDALPLPQIDSAALPGGAQMLFVPGSEQPWVTVSAWFPIGDGSNPIGREGTVGLAMAVLDRGTSRRSAAEILRELELRGATLSAAAGVDLVSVTLSTPAAHLSNVLPIMTDVLTDAVFPEEEIELERQQLLTSLRQSRSQASSVASQTFFQSIYRGHRYARYATPESVSSLTRDDLISFRDRVIHPSRALIVVSGAVDSGRIERMLTDHLSVWGERGASPPLDRSIPDRASPSVTLVDMPGTVQSEIRVGVVLPPAQAEMWASIDVANGVLGLGPAGRLYKRLREGLGFTYGAGSSAVERSDAGYFLASTAVRTEVTDSAVAEVLGLIDDLASVGPQDQEVELVASAIAGPYSIALETPAAVAGTVAQARFWGRPVSSVAGYPAAIASVSVRDAEEVARRHFAVDTMTIVVAGDASRVESALRDRFGTRLRVVLPEGQPPG